MELSLSRGQLQRTDTDLSEAGIFFIQVLHVCRGIAMEELQDVWV